MNLGDAPTIVDYASLAALVGLVEVYHATDLPGTKFWRRLARRDRLTIRLLPYACAVLIWAVAPKDRYLAWWLAFLAAGLEPFFATVAPPIVMLRRLRDLRALWPGPEQRRSAISIIALIVVSAAAATGGMVLVALITQDARFAAASALTVAFLLRWAWVLLSRRRFPHAGPLSA